MIVDLLQSVLEASGVSLLAAYDGKEALALAREHRPELVLTDIMCPDWTGESSVWSSSPIRRRGTRS